VDVGGPLSIWGEIIEKGMLDVNLERWNSPSDLQRYPSAGGYPMRT